MSNRLFALSFVWLAVMLGWLWRITDDRYLVFKPLCYIGFASLALWLWARLDRIQRSTDSTTDHDGERVMSRHPEIDEAFRREVCDWFRANGVEPSMLPSDPQASIDGGRLTFRQAVLSALTFTYQRDPADPNRILTEVVTVPLVVEPSADITEWLRPKCLRCGR